jgi:iron complex outermembrane receptor protein
VIFELYSTRFGTATPNPDLGPERATNVEVGWNGDATHRVRLSGALFYSNVRDLIQTVVLPDTTTQTQNVGNGDFYGAEVSIDAQGSRRLSAGANYTFVHRKITDALQPNLRPTGVPTHKAFLYAAWRAVDRLRITPRGHCGRPLERCQPCPGVSLCQNRGLRTGHRRRDLHAREESRVGDRREKPARRKL